MKYEFHLIQGDPKHVLTAHAEVGVGGGGGVDIGSGLLYELTAGYRYQLSPLFAITVEAGGVNADKGSFEAQVFQLGINWSMQRAVLR